MKVLEYRQWRRFENVINKAKLACKNSLGIISHDFANVGKIVEAGALFKKITDYKLSRYACYLIAQNGDSRKNVIALAQTYFAVQTRKQEIFERDYELLTEEERRFYKRDLTRKGNLSLNKTAQKAGVKNFDQFHNYGYKGLYNGETANDIAHYNVGKNVRDVIAKNGGTMPENLPTPEKSLKQLEKEQKKHTKEISS